MTDQNQPLAEPTIPAMTEVYDQKPAKTSGLAVTSLVLGIIAFITCGITAPFGLILGIISVIQINKNRESLTGQPLAVAGIVTSGIAFLMIPIMAALVFPIYARAREAARTTDCLHNVKNISMGMMMFSDDNDGTLPISGEWVKSISVYVPDNKSLHCPFVEIDKTTYAMNSKLSKASINKIPAPPDTIMVFESIPGDNPNGGIELLPNPARHRYIGSQGGSQRIGRASSGGGDTGINSIAFADGHVKALTIEATRAMVWDPAKQ